MDAPLGSIPGKPQSQLRDGPQRRNHPRTSNIGRIGMNPWGAVPAGEQAGRLLVPWDRPRLGIVGDWPAKLLGEIGQLAACAGNVPPLEVPASTRAAFPGPP